MDKKLFWTVRTATMACVVLLTVFGLISCFFSIVLGICELAAAVFLLLYDRRLEKKRRRELARYVDSLFTHADNAIRTSSTRFPMPTLVVSSEGEKVVWCNEAFCQIAEVGEDFFGRKLSELLPDFNPEWVVKGENSAPEVVSVGRRRFSVYGSSTRIDPQNPASGVLMIFYWIEMTELYDLRDRFEKSRPAVAIIMIDNYEEMLVNCTESDKSTILAGIDRLVTRWTQDTEGVLRKYDRAKYLFVFEKRHLNRYIEEKFKVLDAVKELQSPEGIAATLSIGIGRGGASYREDFEYASLAVEMALSRGGDQAVVKSNTGFEFFGGRAIGTEKRTKVRSRVLANALGQMMSEASVVLVMGHRMSDLDSVGAAAGVVCMARKFGRRAYIVTNRTVSNAESLIARLEKHGEYDGVFITASEAETLCDSRCLLVVVDTNRPEVTEHPELIRLAHKVAVIDHHRRAASYIEGCAISMHEPYASSASELVAELMQYSVSAKDVLRGEAEALLSGIALDTKFFAIKTGVRTFEAAAYLRRMGADTVEVKTLFQNDFKDYLEKNRIVENAVVRFGRVAISRMDHEVSRAVAGQAADEMLSIAGIKGSAVLFLCDGQVFISARSMGQINMQVIMEKLGGGGSLTNAGAQLRDTTISEAEACLLDALKKYFEEEGGKAGALR